MSGGSWNYVCYQVSEASREMSSWDKELSELLKDISKVCHDCEWAEDSDISDADAFESISKFKKKWFGSDRNDRLKKYIDEIFDNARKNAYSTIGTHEE